MENTLFNTNAFALAIAFNNTHCNWRTPKFLVRPTWGSKYVKLRKVRTWSRSWLPALKGEGRAKSPGIRLGRETIILLHGPTSKTNHKLVKTHSASFWCWDKPRATLDSLDSPRPELGGSHHLPPYRILCIAPPRPRPSGSLSRDSQSGVPKLSRCGLPGLWAIINHNFSPQPPIGTSFKPIL
jgi:hypothetical protein